MEDHNNNKEACITGLTLGLGIGGYDQPINQEKHKKVNIKHVPSLDLTFELYHPKSESEDIDVIKHDEEAHDDEGFNLKRTDEGFRNEKSVDSTNDKNNIGSRKKLRLTKEQSTLLEESFKLHTTLNQVQKQTLAEQLNLKHRQVEVWFQNRRARAKLKQTEVDCEFLKKCCEKLTGENLRLKKELQELRALKVEPSPLYIQLSSKGPPILAMCSSCEEKLMKINIEGKDVVVSDVGRNNDNHKL